MAISSCQNGPTHYWHKARDWRVCRGGILAHYVKPTRLSGPLGHQIRVVINPEDLAKHYTRFRVTERILLTGHSHQAWPDVAFEAQQQAWLDAAELVDDVWDKAFEKANAVRRGFAGLLDDSPDRIALAPNTHELVVRFLSGLNLKKRPQLITTDGEFHTIRRQLDRLAEEGIEVVKVAALPAATLAQRLAE